MTVTITIDVEKVSGAIDTVWMATARCEPSSGQISIASGETPSEAIGRAMATLVGDPWPLMPK